MGVTIKPTEVRSGSKLEFDGEVYVCTKYEHYSPGKGQALIRIKIKHMKTGRVLDKTIKTSDSIEKAVLDPKKVEYLYRDDELHFMDSSTYEQFSLPPEALLGKDVWLKDNTEISLLFWNGEPVDVEIPLHQVYEVTETDPGLKGDTVSGGNKPATLETGAVVQVPLFVNVGDKIKVDTRDGAYIERA